MSALAALANGLLPLRKIAQAEAERKRERERELTPGAEPFARDLVPMPPLAAPSSRCRQQR